jgi:hypothetical protein
MAAVVRDRLKGGEVLSIASGQRGGVGYNDTTRIAHFVAFDGDTVTCFRIVGIAKNDAMLIAAEWSRLTVYTLDAFRETVDRALG